MKRALLTVNFNNALCENSRASMKAACSRWCADFIELNEGFFENRWKPKVSPATLKCFCFEFCNHDEFFILDADTVVSSQCPNCFETFNWPEVVAVRNGSLRFVDLWQIRSCEEYEWQKLREEEPRLADVIYTPGTYWNSGMMLVKRQYHKEMFDLVSDIVQTDHSLGWNDQTPLNMCALACGIKTFYAPEQWNYIHPCMLGGDWLNMKATGTFIYHGAGEPNRINWLPRVIWN